MRFLLGCVIDCYINFHVVVREVTTALGHLIDDALDAWGDDE